MKQDGTSCVLEMIMNLWKEELPVVVFCHC